MDIFSTGTSISDPIVWILGECKQISSTKEMRTLFIYILFTRDVGSITDIQSFQT